MAKAIALASFAHEWVGGDIHGLAGLAGTLYGYAPEISGVASALDSQVSGVVGAAGWQGTAASTFSSAWGRDSQAARAVGLCADQIAGIVGWLAVTLSQLESELEAAASTAASHGVTIGASGAPVIVDGPPANAAEATAEQWASAYQQFYTQCIQGANTARKQAAGELATTVSQVATDKPDGEAPGLTAHLASGAVAADLLGDLIAVPSAFRREAEEKVDDIWDGLKGTMESFLKDHAMSETDLAGLLKTGITKLGSADEVVTDAKDGENALTKLADTRVSDVELRAGKIITHFRGTPSTEADPAAVADAGDDAGMLSKFTDFAKDIPVLDVLAGAAGTGLATYDDAQHGIPVGVALPVEAAGNFGGVAVGYSAGVAAGAAIGGGLAGAALGAGVGGVVAVGVADDVHSLLVENWGGDINKYGVAGGVLYGVGHAQWETLVSLGDTAKDLGSMAAHAGSAIGHAASSVWHSIF